MNEQFMKKIKSIDSGEMTIAIKEFKLTLNEKGILGKRGYETYDNSEYELYNCDKLNHIVHYNGFNFVINEIQDESFEYVCCLEELWSKIDLDNLSDNYEKTSVNVFRSRLNNSTKKEPFIDESLSYSLKGYSKGLHIYWFDALDFILLKEQPNDPYEYICCLNQILPELPNKMEQYR